MVWWLRAVALTLVLLDPWSCEGYLFAPENSSSVQLTSHGNRIYHCAAAYRGQIFTMGGQAPWIVDSPVNGLASADAGTSWPQALPNDHVRSGGRMVVYQLPGHSLPSLVITGGWSGVTDWITWDVSFLLDAQPRALWVQVGEDRHARRGNHGFVVAQSASSAALVLFVFGGQSYSQTLNDAKFLNDVWVRGASDSSWLQLPDAPWTPRHLFAYATLEDQSRVLLTGGMGDDAGNDVWVSNVGLSSWTQLNRAPFQKRFGASLLNINDNFYLIGGASYEEDVFFSDVWVSPNFGQSWMLVTPAAGFSPRAYFSAVVIGKKAVLIGGFAPEYDSIDVWSATLG